MNNDNVNIARQLLKMAKELIAVPTSTVDDFEKFNTQYQKENNGKSADSSIWDLFETEDEAKNFLKLKYQNHPNLSEFIDKNTLRTILEEGYFTICSAGISSSELKILDDKYMDENGNIINQKEYEKEKNNLVKERLNDLCRFLDTLNVKYYEALGQFYDEITKTEYAELSYIVDLTNIGTNNDMEAKQIMKKVCNYCGNKMNQTAVIEGIKGIRAYVYCDDRSHRLNKGKGDKNQGRSTVRNDNNTQESWSDDYGFSDKQQEKPSKKDWI